MQVVIRALRVLTILGKHPEGLTMTDIATALELPAATTHRIAAVLEEQQFITRSPSSRRFFLGPAVRELVATDTHHSSFVTRHPAIAAASRKSGETTFLCEFAGDKVVCTALAESSYPLRLFVHVGQSMPLHAAASARTLLAWQPPELIRRLLAGARLTAYTPDTPSTVDEVIDHLETIRRSGYDICHSELDANVWAVSAPVRSSDGGVVASITLAAPAHRMCGDVEREEALEAVLGATREMSADLGWTED